MRNIRIVVWFVVGVVASACGKQEPVAAAVLVSPAATAGPLTPSAPPGPAIASPSSEPPLPGWPLDAADINERIRDPFQRPAQDAEPPADDGWPVVLSQYSIEQLRLVAIVSSAEGPRAMLVDPTGAGTVVRRGDYVGRTEPARVGAPRGAPRPSPWRVERIHRADVFLVRDDGAAARAGVTRVLSLGTAEPERPQKLAGVSATKWAEPSATSGT